jgi:2-keto-4-pentenoate hydratase/2-oxohepta-3-ene-1,7-dioic acid hydratase in catechol pathway
MIPLDSAGEINNIDFHLDLNGSTVQTGNSKDMIFSFDQVISYISRFITLKMGDLIFTGTPAGVSPVKIGDHLEGYLGKQKMLDFYVR